MFEKPATSSIPQNSSASELLISKKKSEQSCIFSPTSDLMIKHIPRRELHYDNYNGLEYLIEI